MPIHSHWLHNVMIVRFFCFCQYSDELLTLLTMPMKAPFNVLKKLQLGTPFRPNLLANMTVMLPPVPPITVLMITRAISSLSPGLVIDPSVPPLNARNPATRIMPPRPVSCTANEKILSERVRVWTSSVILDIPVTKTRERERKFGGKSRE